MEGKKILSQWEIDTLLASIDKPSEDQTVAPEIAKNVKAYDFRRPDKFSKDHIRSLQVLHESFARIATSSLTAALRMSVSIRLSSVEQATHDDYLQQLPNPTVIGVSSMDPLPGRMIVETSLEPAYAMVDRLLGGQGRPLARAREVTEIEFSILETLLRNLMASLKEAWSGIISLEPKLEELVLNPQMVHVAKAGEVVVLLLFEIQFSESSGTISMCIPYTMLEPIMAKLGTQMWLAGTRRETGKSNDREVLAQLGKASVPLTVQLGTSTVTVRELLGLQAGNVIVLQTSASAELPVLIGGKPKLLVRPGRVGRRLAVQVTHKLLEEDDVTSVDRRAAVSA